MKTTISNIFSLFNKKERTQAYWIFAGMVVRGLIEVAGIASIMPFIAVVSNPEVIHTNNILSKLYQYLGLESSTTFIVIFGVIVLGVIILNNSIAALTDWYLFRFTWLRGHSLSSRLFGKYLSEPYLFFLNKNTAELGANILNEINYYMKGVLRPFMEMTARLIVTLFIFVLLLMVDPVLAVTIGLVLGGVYAVIFLSVQKRLAKIGKDRVTHTRQQYKYINEAFGGIKDIKVKGCEAFFLNSFYKHSYNANMAQVTHQIVSQVPRYALDVVAFGGILLIMLYFVVANKNTNEMIPLMALYAFAGYRLMPALQNVFSGITTVRFNLSLLDKLYKDLVSEGKPEKSIKREQKKRVPLEVHHTIEVKDLHFRYGADEQYVINGLNLKIRAKTIVGLVGTTGAGKTTFVDILLGLLLPTKGNVLADDVKIEEEKRERLLANIGYVPQFIFLSDQSVRENIALGIPEDEISDERVMEAAKMADLHHFIVNDLPHGYDSVVGERGVRLSGGQRQRIGIARALYNDPAILILDEATSSLDNITEKNVISAIKNLGKRKTIIMIAHRLTTLEDCDVIHFLADGNVLDSGSYVELETRCPEFKRLAEARSVNGD